MRAILVRKESCCQLSDGINTANWEHDDPKVVRERRGYWLTGWATGPDTVLGAVWSVGFLYAVTADAVCGKGPTGLSSGADGSACMLTHLWNQTHFESVGGDACYGSTALGLPRYYHDASKPGCMDAFASYRTMVDFTCNCSGASADHAYLASGPRPSTVYTLAQTLALLCVAVSQLVLGTAVDYMDKRKLLWMMITIICGLVTCGMAVVGTKQLWIVGFVMMILTIIFSEIVTPIRSSYLEDVAKDEATMGYTGAMRQFTSYTSQIIFVIAFFIFQSLYTSPTPGDESVRMAHSMMGSIYAGVWFLVFMPWILCRYFTEHPAKRTKPHGTSVAVLAFTSLYSELRNVAKYPEAFKFLIATSILMIGGPVVIAVSSTFATEALEMPSIYYTITTAAVLVIGVPAALGLAYLMRKSRLSMKLAWLIDAFFFILIAVLVPSLCTGPNFGSWIVVIILAGVLGGVALSWYFSIGWNCFCMLIPPGQGGHYSGVYSCITTIFSIFGPLIYSAVVEATNNHQVAWAVTCVPSTVIAFALLCWIDFDKGKRDANFELRAAATTTVKPATASA